MEHAYPETTMPAPAAERPRCTSQAEEADGANLVEGREIGARRWVALVVAAMLVQTGLVMAFNFVVDPRAEFQSDVIEPLVVDSRELKVLAYAGLEPKPETIVVGSSRAMTISPALLEASGYGSSYNFAVDSGKITDALRVLEETIEAGAPPERMIVVTEDWAFRSAVQVEWPAREGIAQGDVLELAARLVASVRLDYVEDSWRSVRLQAEGRPLRDMAFQPDGTVVWEKHDHRAATGTLDDQLARDKLEMYTRGMYDAPLGPEPAYTAALDELLAAARASGTHLTFVMPPMTQGAAAHVDADAYAASLAATRALLLRACGPGVEVRDLSDPSTYGATDADFIDGFHPTREGGERLTRAILERPGLCP